VSSLAAGSKKHLTRFPDEYIWLALCAVALMLAYAWGDFNLLTILTMANIWAVFAVSWDILSGYTGQISFGHAFFIGVGGYVSALCSIALTPHVPMPWLVVASILLAGAAAALGGVLLALPAVRLHGPYLSLMTLVAAAVAERVVRILKLQSTGAEGAITGLPNFGFVPNQVFSYSAAFVLAISLLLVILARSRIGKIFQAIRESEQAAAAAGINTAKYKILAFAVSGFVAGAAGAFYAHYLGSVAPASHFLLDISVFCIVASVLGGMGTIIGPLAGSYLYILIQENFRPLGSWRFLALFLVALGVLFFLPRGYLTELRVRAFQLLQWALCKKPRST